MSQVSASFAGLPAELLTYIVQLALEDECEEHCRWGARSWKLPENFSGPSLLAPIHISSKIRSAIFGRSAIWRLLTAKVIASLGSRSHSQSVELLSFCASQTRHTLRDVDLEQFEWTKSNCAQQLQELVQIVALSSQSLERLHLPAFPQEFLEACPCASCKTNPEAAIESVWTAILDVLAKAKALQSLILDVPRSVDFSHIANDAALVNDFDTHPSYLRVRVIGGHKISTSFIKLMARLSQRLHRLRIWVDGDTLTNMLDIHHFVSSVTQAGCPTLRYLCLFGVIDGSTVVGLSGYEWPFLEELYIEFELEETLAMPDEQIKRCIPSLKRLQVPAWLLASFETPNLEWAVLGLDSEEEGLVLQNLHQWRLLDSLVLYPQLPANHASLMIRNILRALTPAKGREYACPELSELGVTSRLVSFEEWMMGDDEEEENDEKADHESYDLDKPYRWQQPGYLDHTPVISSDLLNLDRTRKHLWSIGRSFPSTGSLAKDGRCPCWPLRTIRILGCLVRSSVWDSLLSEALPQEERHCSPDPSKVVKSLKMDDKQKLIPNLLAAYQRLDDGL